MKNKAEYMAQARAENPRPQFRIVNGERIELTEAEYENSLEAWAEMRLAQEAEIAALEASAAAKVSARAKLAALGLSEDEVSALLGASDA